MTAAKGTQVRVLKRRAAKRPVARTVHVVMEDGDFEGWEVTAKADFPASVLADLEAGSIARIIVALDAIVVDHNLPNADDEVAQRMGDVDPYEGLLELASRIFDAIGKLPNR